MRFVMILVCVVSLATSRSMTFADNPPQSAAKLDKTVTVELDYLLYLPEGYEQQDSWPLLVFLHGAGERGDDLQQVKKHGPPKLIEAGRTFPFIVVSPQCPSDKWWPWQLRELSALIDDIENKYKVDQRRIYLTGLSMGGFGTWALAAYDHDRFAAIAPICGGGEVYTTVRQLANTPTWAFHGARDPIVPLERSEVLVEALKRVNDQVKFTVYPDALHDSWSETYDNPELYTWLLQQQLQPDSQE